MWFDNASPAEHGSNHFYEASVNLFHFHVTGLSAHKRSTLFLKLKVTHAWKSVSVVVS